MSATSTLDERKLVWFFIRIKGRKGSAVYRGCVDTGATYCVLNPTDCRNLDLIRKNRDKAKLITVKGETTAPVYVALSMRIENTELEAKDVQLVARRVKGFPLIIGMSFLEHFNWCFDKDRNLFEIKE